jgi:hypothetical protein
MIKKKKSRGFIFKNKHIYSRGSIAFLVCQLVRNDKLYTYLKDILGYIK